MADLKDLNKLYTESTENFIWKSHSIWKSLTGKQSTVPCTSIVNFWKEKGLDVFNSVADIDSYSKAINKASKDYVAYCERKGKETGDFLNWTKDDLEDLVNFFKGFMGEYFFIDIFLDRFKGSLIIKNRNYSNYFARTYHFVAPLHEVKDFGIDGTCVDDTGKNCVIQVKFWNHYDPHINLKLDVVQKAYCEGVVHNYIDSYEQDNVIICWLGTNDKVSKYLKEDADLEKHVVFVDMDVINKSIKGNLMFWSNTFVTEMNRLIQM